MNAVEQGFACLGRGQAEMPAKIGTHPRKDYCIYAILCCLSGDLGRCSIKCVSGYPPNWEKSLPYITGVMVLIDPETGLTSSIMDAGWITAWRTGAAPGMYAKYFGDPASGVLSVISLSVLTGLKAAFTYSVYDIFIFGKKYLGRYETVNIFPYALPVDALGLYPLVDFTHNNPKTWDFLILLLATTWRAFPMHYAGLRRLESIRTTIMATLELVVSAGLAWLWGEHFSPAGCLGSGLILSAVTRIKAKGARHKRGQGDSA